MGANLPRSPVYFFHWLGTLDTRQILEVGNKRQREREREKRESWFGFIFCIEIQIHTRIQFTNIIQIKNSKRLECSIQNHSERERERERDRSRNREILNRAG